MPLPGSSSAIQRLCARCINDLPKQHCGRDWSDAAGYRGQRRRNRPRRISGCVPDQVAIGARVRAHVDDDRAGAHVFEADQPSAPNRGDQHVSSTADPCQITRPRMVPGHRCVLGQQQERQRLADDGASAYDDHLRARQRHPFLTENPHNCGGRRGDIGLEAWRQPAKAYRIGAIHILLGRDEQSGLGQADPPPERASGR